MSAPARVRRTLGPALAAVLAPLFSACAPALAGGQETQPTPLPASAPANEPAAIPPGKAPPSGPYAPGWDALHYEVELALPDGPGWIAGRTRIAVARTNPPVTVLPLDLVGLAVQRVRVNGNDAPIDQRDGKLFVATGTGLAQNIVQVEVTYAGVPDDGLVLGRTLQGQPSAFADNWPDRARYWFPSIDHPSDKATVTFTVHAPARWQVVANGTLTGPPSPTPTSVGGPAGERRTWRWRTNVAIPTYTMVIGGTELVVDTVGAGACGRAPASPAADKCAPVTTWLYPADREKGLPSFRRAARMLDLFSDWIGIYPYEKLAHVQSSTRFGGMENVSAIFYDQRGIDAGQNIESTVAHETAHQWFGDSVTEADWHHLWLSEGFADYFQALFYEWADGKDAFRREMEGFRLGYLTSSDVDKSILDSNASDLFDLLNHNNYEKGAWVLHMLRGVVGDSTFHVAIQQYYGKHRGGTALTSDLQDEMQRASGKDLGWFFDQWLTKPGYPVLRVTQRWDAGAREVTVTVEQIQRASWPRFRVPTEVLVRGSWGEKRVPIELNGPSTSVRIPVPAPPDAAVVDPGGWVLKAVEGESGAPAGR